PTTWAARPASALIWLPMAAVWSADSGGRALSVSACATAALYIDASAARSAVVNVRFANARGISWKLSGAFSLPVAGQPKKYRLKVDRSFRYVEMSPSLSAPVPENQPPKRQSVNSGPAKSTSVLMPQVVERSNAQSGEDTRSHEAGSGEPRNS